MSAVPCRNTYRVDCPTSAPTSKLKDIVDRRPLSKAIKMHANALQRQGLVYYRM